jgi:hypothetical protein
MKILNAAIAPESLRIVISEDEDQFDAATRMTWQ